jgi:hypothetical protein
MIDHMSLAVHDLVASAEAYERMLAPLGLGRLVERSGAVSFGKRYPELWLNHRPGQIAMPPDTGAHVCLRSPDEGSVRAFHAAALAGGCKDAGAPGPRHFHFHVVARFADDPNGPGLPPERASPLCRLQVFRFWALDDQAHH